MDNEYYVYLLKCNDDSYYKGITSNLDRRFKQHLLGQCQSTKNKCPRIVFVQICRNRSEARYFEKYLKSGIGREIIAELI